MKFHQLRSGARFHYRGQIFHKISPLKGACENDDTQRLIPRSAEVVELDEQGEAITRMLPETLPGARVERLLEQFFGTCEEAMKRTEPPLGDGQRDQLLRALQSAGRELLARLAATG